MASAFTQELIDEIRRDHYGIRAWQRFMSRSWARSFDDVRESPERARSFWLWTAGIAATGFSVVLLAWLFHAREVVTGVLVVWLPWYAGSVMFVLTHLGMADTVQGVPHRRLLLPNGISYLRLALAPLVLLPYVSLPLHPMIGWIYASFLAGMLASDMLDGWVARRQENGTRLGRILDLLGDLALLSFLAVGLHRVGAIPESLLWLLIARYPLMLIGVLVLYFARGPAPISPTVIGRVTTFATSIVLLVIAVDFLFSISWLPSFWIDWSVWSLQFLIGANILYLLYRGAFWAASKEAVISTPDPASGAKRVASRHER